MSHNDKNKNENAIREPVAVLGLGRSGNAVADLLLGNDVPFTAWDDNDRVRGEAEKKGVTIKDYAIEGLERTGTLIPAAGIPPRHSVIQKAFELGIDVLSDIDLLYTSAPKQTYIGITGTNGKSTTTALVGHILSKHLKNVAVGGNIGKAALRLPFYRRHGHYVLELSSYQLFYTKRARFDITVLLNITPDHLDWHGSMADYIAAKASLFQQTPHDKRQTVVIGVDTPASEKLYMDLMREGQHDVIPISTQVRVDGGLYYHNNAIINDIEHKEEQILTLGDNLALRGSHNHQNIMAAIAVAQTLGIKTADIVESVKSFDGLPHRQQHVRTIGRTLYINDSKATNFEAASKAITTYDNIHLILGGVAKDGGIDGIESYASHITHVYLIGDAEKKFAKTLKRKIPFTKCGTLEKAVETAHKNAQKDGTPSTVMLSPACASFDQFLDYENRGERFMALVNALLEKLPEERS